MSSLYTTPMPTKPAVSLLNPKPASRCKAPYAASA